MDQALKGVEFALGVVERLPTWMQLAVLWLVGVVLILFLLKHILKSLTDPELTSAARTLGGVVRKSMLALLRGVFAPLESPIQRPRTKFVFTCLSVVHSYLSAVVFLFFLLTLGFLYILSQSGMSFLQNMAALGVSLVLFYFMVFFRAEADRDYLKAKALWAQRANW